MGTTLACFESTEKRATRLLVLALSVALAVAGPLAACSSGGGTCHYPAGVETEPDASDSFGCFAVPPGRLCEVSNGATVLPDGGVTDGTESCHSLCSGSDYRMTCTGPPSGAAMPTPDSTLGCSIVPLPTPAGVSIYCCPCN